MNTVNVSIIVPIYNTEKYLDHCIKSIVGQSYKNIEVILVDDGSEDKSGCICDTWAKRDNRVRVIHKDNGGLVSAWKAGLNESTFEWVSFIDSDDWMEPNHIKVLVDEYKKSDAEIIVTRMKQVSNNKEQYIPFYIEAKNYSGKALANELYPKMLNIGEFEKRGVPVSRCSKLIKKKLVIDNLKYTSNITTYEEDLNIMFPTMLDARSISLVEANNAAYCYRRVEKSMLHGYDSKMKESIEHIYPALKRVCIEKNKEEFLSQIGFEYVSAMIRCVTNELQNPKGLNVTKKNIKLICEDPNLRQNLSIIDLKQVTPKFRIIIKMLYNYNWFNRNIMTLFLRLLKKIKN